jgi:hypothetical protein
MLKSCINRSVRRDKAKRIYEQPNLHAGDQRRPSIAKAFLPHQRVTTEGFMADDDYTMGEFLARHEAELKERRRMARNSAHEGMKAFFNVMELSSKRKKHSHLRTPQGTVSNPAKQADAA